MILNLKKGIIELLILSLLNKRPLHTFEILRFISEKSGSVCAITHPYNIFYRLLDRGLIVESEKKMAEDCRRRQYYAITPQGRAYYRQIRSEYESFISGAGQVLAFSDEEDQEN